MSRVPLWDRLALVAARYHALSVYRRFLRAVHEGPVVQHRVLLEKVRLNAASEYGRAMGLRSVRCYEDFRRCVPLQTYEDIAPYIDRMREGRFSALLGPGQRLIMFALTSGTSGEPKHIPVTAWFLREYRRGWNAFGVKALLDHPEAILRPIVQVTSPMDETRTPAGTPCGAITGLLAATQKRLVRRYYVVPPEVAYVKDAPAKYYTIVRLCLPHRRIGFFITASPATQLRLAQTLATFAEALIRDVHDGTLAGHPGVPDWIRRSLRSRLRADPERARELSACLERRGELLPRDVWQIGFLANWTGGSMSLYLERFGHYFGGTPVRDIGLLASEGRMSIPVEDGTPAGLLDVLSHFYEFIPAEEIDSRQPTTLRSHEVESGHEYFIVLTTSSGLYRYNIGDQVRVVGFAGPTPIIEFLNKGSHISSIAGEKLTERQVVLAAGRLASGTFGEHTRFVLAPRWADPPYYRLYVEDGVVRSVEPARLARRMDDALAAVNIEYASKRHTARLGPVEVAVVPSGTFAECEREHRLRNPSAGEQYKHRFLLAEPGMDAPLAERACPAGETIRRPADASGTHR